MKLFIEYFNRTVAAVTDSTKTAVTYLSTGKTKIEDIVEYSKTKLVLLGGKFYDEYFNIFTENTAIVDNPINSLNKPRQESLLLQDASLNIFGKGLTEDTELTEKIDKNYRKNILDSIAVTENIFYKESALATGETVGITDDLNGVATDDDQTFDIFKPLNDTALLLDSIVRGIDSNKSELVGVTSSGVVGNQDFGSDYFLEDYVGVSTTIS